MADKKKNLLNYPGADAPDYDADAETTGQALNRHLFGALKTLMPDSLPSPTPSPSLGEEIANAVIRKKQGKTK